MTSRNVWQEKPAEPPALTTSASHRGLAGFWGFAVCGVLSPRHKPPCCSPGIGLAQRQPASHFIKPRSCSEVFFFFHFLEQLLSQSLAWLCNRSDVQRTEPWRGGGGSPFLLFTPCPKAFGCTEHPRPAYPQGREEN